VAKTRLWNFNRVAATCSHRQLVVCCFCRCRVRGKLIFQL